MCLSYDTSVDLWALGCIFAELHTRTALFEGQHERHQLSLIFGTIGTPSEDEWPEKANVMRSNFLAYPKQAWTVKVPTLEPQGQDLLDVSIIIRIHNPFLIMPFFIHSFVFALICAEKSKCEKTTCEIPFYFLEFLLILELFFCCRNCYNFTRTNESQLRRRWSTLTFVMCKFRRLRPLLVVLEMTN